MNTEAKFLISLDSGDDPWGHAMGHMFAIAHTLYMFGGPIPSAWQYRPGLREDEPRGEWPDSEWESLYEDGSVTADDLVQAGNVLSRYINILDSKGLSY